MPIPLPYKQHLSRSSIMVMPGLTFPVCLTRDRDGTIFWNCCQLSSDSQSRPWRELGSPGRTHPPQKWLGAEGLVLLAGSTSSSARTSTQPLLSAHGRPRPEKCMARTLGEVLGDAARWHERAHLRWAPACAPWVPVCACLQLVQSSTSIDAVYGGEPRSLSRRFLSLERGEMESGRHFSSTNSIPEKQETGFVFKS